MQSVALSMYVHDLIVESSLLRSGFDSLYLEFYSNVQKGFEILFAKISSSMYHLLS